MADFSSEWRKVENLGGQMHNTEMNLQRVRAQIPSAESAVTSAQMRLNQAQGRLNSIPSYYGDDYETRSRYEQMRASAAADVSSASSDLHTAENRLNGLRSQERSLNAQLLAHRTEAEQAANEYRDAGNQARTKAAPANAAASKFEQISGLRFGKNAAAAGSELANQRALHYQSQATAYAELTEAATMAGRGIIPQIRGSAIAPRGTFNPVSTAASSVAVTAKPSVINPAGITGAAAINTAALTALASNSGTSVSPSAAGIKRFSAASVPYSAGENGSALNAMINKLRLSEEDFSSLLNENGLCMAASEKSNTAELTTVSAVKASPEKIDILAQPAPAKSGKSTKKKIDGHTYYYDANNEVYRVDDTLVENSSYELNGYKFSTDEKGRVESVEGKLHFRNEKRKNISDTKEVIGKGYEQLFDERGHLIADLFEGPNGLENIIMQNAHLNHSDYRKLENQLADCLNKNYDVRVRVSPIYEGDSFRPARILYEYWIDGERQFQSFPNLIETEKGKSQ